MLRRHSLDPLDGENGREALEALRQRRVDLVLLDIEMPEMDGYEVLEALAADPRLRDLPVVMMSSVDEVDRNGQGEPPHDPPDGCPGGPRDRMSVSPNGGS